MSQDWGPVQVVLATAVAGGVAGGMLSPDLDQSRFWRRTDRVLPDESLGRGGPMRHRGLSHWWGIPLAVGFAIPHLAEDVRWVLTAVVVGWVSHLIGDFVFGKRDRYAHRGPGIPLAPWWGHVGLGLDSGGSAEAAVRTFVLPTVLVWELVEATGFGHPIRTMVAGLLAGS